jgi:hypothetical protein
MREVDGLWMVICAGSCLLSWTVGFFEEGEAEGRKEEGGGA